MKKISIITRAYNRLEYTIQCVRAVKLNTDWDNYEHIIFNNNSSDGTKEWLKWIANMPSQYFDKVRSIHSPVNLGDWGGMQKCSQFIEDTDYVVQLDNDIEVPQGWLTSMVNVLEETEVGIVMLRRKGVQQTLVPTNRREVAGEAVGDIGFCVACYIVRAEDWFKYSLLVKGCTPLGPRIDKGCIKIMNKVCYQIEGWDGESYLQHTKYTRK